MAANPGCRDNAIAISEGAVRSTGTGWLPTAAKWRAAAAENAAAIAQAIKSAPEPPRRRDPGGHVEIV
jgi:hypothetical protein